MKVSAAAESNLLAIPCRRWAEDTKMRGIPRGVGSGVGWQNRPAFASTGNRVGVVPGYGCASLLSSGEAMAIAVDIRWAMRQPAIFSRAELFIGDRRNK
jgi:hypothetical protein